MKEPSHSDLCNAGGESGPYFPLSWPFLVPSSHVDCKFLLKPTHNKLMLEGTGENGLFVFHIFFITLFFSFVFCKSLTAQHVCVFGTILTLRKINIGLIITEYRTGLQV